MARRTNTAVWNTTLKQWKIGVQKDGVRKYFYSGTPGRTGQREANAKADAWLDENIRGTNKKVSALYAEWIEHLKLTCGTSYVEQCDKYGEYYILPVCGNLKISDLSEGHLQTVIDKSFKQRCLKKERQTKSQKKPLSKKTLMTIRSVERAFIKWCRFNRYTTLNPENLSIPKSARTKEKVILQPDALKILFSVENRLLRGKPVFDDYVYA